mmetsp:Transcript_930/g.3033  ORF Transcript_930/g.3033 Transcript_930/m.3033 type:complete len:225 (-) Transcript_930:246-920(-)
MQPGVRDEAHRAGRGGSRADVDLAELEPRRGMAAARSLARRGHRDRRPPARRPVMARARGAQAPSAGAERGVPDGRRQRHRQAAPAWGEAPLPGEAHLGRAGPGRCGADHGHARRAGQRRHRGRCGRLARRKQQPDRVLRVLLRQAILGTGPDKVALQAQGMRRWRGLQVHVVDRHPPRHARVAVQPLADFHLPRSIELPRAVVDQGEVPLLQQLVDDCHLASL